MIYKSVPEMSKEERLTFLAELVARRKKLSESIEGIRRLKLNDPSSFNVYECEVAATGLGAYIRVGDGLSVADSNAYSKGMREAALRRYFAALVFMEEQALEQLEEVESALKHL